MHRVSDQSSTIPIHYGLRAFEESFKNRPDHDLVCDQQNEPSTYRSVKIRVEDVNITTAYESQKAAAEEELELLQHLECHNNGKANRVGDINSRHSDWDTGNNRGRQLEMGNNEWMGRKHHLKSLHAQVSMTTAPRYIHGQKSTNRSRYPR